MTSVCYGCHHKHHYNICSCTKMNIDKNNTELTEPEITLVHFWADYMHERSATSDQLNSEEMLGKVVEQLVGRQLQIGQLIAPVRFRGKVLQLVVKEFTVRDSPGTTSSEIGQLTEQSTVLFSIIPGSRLQLTGSAVYRNPNDRNNTKLSLKSRFTSFLPRRFKS